MLSGQPQNLSSTPRRKSRPFNFDIIWNFLTLLVLFSICGMIGWFALIFLDPSQMFNPFPPQINPAAEIPQIQVWPTNTSVPVALPPTWTPTNTTAPTITNTPKPPTITPTIFVIQGPPTAIPPTAEPSATPTQASNLPFALRGSIVAISSNVTRPDSGCNWMGVGGQVFDMQGAPIVGYTIQLGGTLASTPVDMLSLTGTALQYGSGGYEFTITDRPIASKKTLWVQLMDKAGMQISTRIYFDTFDDCEKNLILVNFKQIR